MSRHPLAARLQAHLDRMAAEPGWPLRSYLPRVTVKDGRVTLQAVAHRPPVSLSEADAQAYADWLDEGRERGWWALATASAHAGKRRTPDLLGIQEPS